MVIYGVIGTGGFIAWFYAIIYNKIASACKNIYVKNLITYPTLRVQAPVHTSWVSISTLCVSGQCAESSCALP